MATKFNMEQILRKIAYSAPVLDAAERAAKKKTLDVTSIAEYTFSSSEITKEINAGPRASNTSGLLGGYGNLYSFIGLVSNPIPAIKELWKSVKFKGLNKVQLNSQKATYSYNVSVPTALDFEDESVIPWAEGRSWLISITRGGISGLGQYLNILGKGRSRGGVQLKKKLRRATMKTAPYFIQIYNTFISNFKGGSKA